jgi:glycosyltransferase involved in cell wall biosynthesis
LKKKLHILFLSSWYPSHVSPSNGDFIQRHAEAIATKHNVTVIYVTTDKNILNTKTSSQTINNVVTNIIYVPKARNLVSKFFLFFNTYIKTINTLVRNFDLVHLNVCFPTGIIALYLKWFKKKPYIISEHWSGYQFPHNKNITTLNKFVSKIIIKNASFVCPVTKHLQTEMEKFGFKGTYFPVPNVVNTSYFTISNKKSKRIVLTHISGMDNSIKNVEGILNVISKLQNKIPNLHFNLIGGNSDKYLVSVKKNNIKSITIVDQIANVEVASYLKNTTVFILFSNYENLPCVIIESFACGVPVVSTNVGGISEYFPKNFGYLINPKDEVALKESILKIINGKINFDKKVMNNYAENTFGVSTISKIFTKLYYKTLKI